ncbi:MAG: type II secretion system protein [Phycisphaerales bacterium]|jgi:prepilin-type N-terminal cleavage/methylation domain-containing protein
MAVRSGRVHLAPFAGRAAFTLVELLVVIAIIALVVSLLFVALRAARGAGSRAGTLSTLRGMASAHAAYALDNRQQLLPGYLNPHLQISLGFITRLPDGTVVSPGAAGTYVWRLAPYADNNWRTFHHGADPAQMAHLTEQFQSGQLGEIAYEPRIGLNTIFIGGDSDAGGELSEYSPWNGSGNPTIAATRLTQLRNPASLVLFAPTRRAEAPGEPDPVRGWHELRAPYLQGRQWQVGPNGVVASDGLQGFAGVPAIAKGETVLPVAFADGSAQAVAITDLSEDMRRWSPTADGPLWRTP